MNQTRKPFWSEKAFAEKASLIPERLRQRNGSFTTAGLDFMVGELIREPGYHDHVHSPSAPIHVYGIPPAALRDREKFIVERSKHEYETYTRRGKTHRRIQKNTTPIMLGGVASWPEPSMAPSSERDRWVRRVVRMCKARWGKLLRSVIGHADESFFHLHVWVDDNGKSVKPHMAMHSYVDDLLRVNPQATRKEMGEAAKAGGRQVQAWYENWAGKPFGHHRSPTPRKRLSRTDALRDRQAQIEAEELAQSKKRAEIVVQAEQIQQALEKLRAREARAAAAEAEVLQHTEMLKRALAKLQEREKAAQDLRAAVKDQIAVERAVARNGQYQAPSVF